MREYEENACPSCGSCSGMYTANSMNCLTEAIGMALPGNGTIPAPLSARRRLAKQAGMQIMELIRERKAVVLLNKSDLEPVVSLEEIAEKSGHRVISISAKEETGIDQLEEEIKSLFYEGEIDFNDQILITNVRHAEALREAYDSIRMVENSIESGMPEDFFSIDLMNAYEKLGLIVGEAVEDDLVNEIFSKFCMGK